MGSLASMFAVVNTRGCRSTLSLFKKLLGTQKSSYYSSESLLVSSNRSLLFLETFALKKVREDAVTLRTSGIKRKDEGADAIGRAIENSHCHFAVLNLHGHRLESSRQLASPSGEGENVFVLFYFGCIELARRGKLAE